MSRMYVAGGFALSFTGVSLARVNSPAAESGIFFAFLGGSLRPGALRSGRLRTSAWFTHWRRAIRIRAQRIHVSASMMRVATGRLEPPRAAKDHTLMQFSHRLSIDARRGKL